MPAYQPQIAPQTAETPMIRSYSAINTFPKTSVQTALHSLCKLGRYFKKHCVNILSCPETYSISKHMQYTLRHAATVD